MPRVNGPEVVALMAEIIRRSVGVELNDVQLATALALHKQIHRRRRRRSVAEIARLSRLLPTRRDRSLVSVVPVFYGADMLGVDVVVLVGDEAEAREDATLYRQVATMAPTKADIYCNEEGLTAPTSGKTRIHVGPPELLRDLPGKAMIISRLPAQRTGELAAAMSGIVTLPEPD
ncbi:MULTISPECIES: hypothetical protein [Thermocrispum]|nr:MULTISPECIES: hypothetical protein [Thermocrispum]